MRKGDPDSGVQSVPKNFRWPRPLLAFFFLQYTVLNYTTQAVGGVGYAVHAIKLTRRLQDITKNVDIEFYTAKQQTQGRSCE